LAAAGRLQTDGYIFGVATPKVGRSNELNDGVASAEGTFGRPTRSTVRRRFVDWRRDRSAVVTA
jgi:hypothetical protein